MFYSAMCEVDKESKTENGGYQQDFPILNKSLARVALNLFDVIDEYLTHRVSVNTSSVHFLIV